MSHAENTTAQELKENNAKYHSECYKVVTNKAKIDRLKEKVNPFPSPVNSEVEVNENEEQPRKKLRLQSMSYDRLRCIICQNEGGKLHQVMCKEIGVRMLEAASSLEDRGFFLRLNTIPNVYDAVANEVMYHLKCWVSVQRIVSKSLKTNENDIDEERVLAEIEIVNTVRTMLEENENNITVTMSEINMHFNNMLSK